MNLSRSQSLPSRTAFGDALAAALEGSDDRQLRRPRDLPLSKLTPLEFEEEVARLLKRDYWLKVKVVGGSGDGGIDVAGIGVDGARIVVQCKRYAPTTFVTPTQVRDLAGARAMYGADYALLATTGALTAQASTTAARAKIKVLTTKGLNRWRSGRRQILTGATDLERIEYVGKRPKFIV